MAVTATDEEARYARQLSALRQSAAPAADQPADPESPADDSDESADSEADTQNEFDPAVAARELGRQQAAATQTQADADAAETTAPEDSGGGITGGAGSFVQRQMMRRLVSKAIFASFRGAIFAFLTYIAPFLLYFALILAFIIIVIFTYFLVTCEIPVANFFLCSE